VSLVRKFASGQGENSGKLPSRDHQLTNSRAAISTSTSGDSQLQPGIWCLNQVTCRLV
jgi:hypothetical protein